MGHLAPVGPSGAAATSRTSAHQEVSGSILSSLLILQMRKQKPVTFGGHLVLESQTETRAQLCFLSDLCSCRWAMQTSGRFLGTPSDSGTGEDTESGLSPSSAPPRLLRDKGPAGQGLQASVFSSVSCLPSGLFRGLMTRWVHSMWWCVVSP